MQSHPLPKCVVCKQYRIAGNVRGRKLSLFSGKLKVRSENFRGLPVLPYKWSPPTKFAGKTIAGDSETAKISKGFSLEIFPLYGNQLKCSSNRDTVCSLAHAAARYCSLSIQKIDIPLTQRCAPH